jgi:voltage-gated potassium channel
MITVIVIGIFGYHFLSDYNWIDAIYMTIITVTTVGFGEVQALNDIGKLFTVSLIILSIIIYGYGISIISEYVLNSRIFENIIRKRMENKVKKLKGHIILVGYGRIGKIALKKLQNFNRQVVVIEKNASLIEKNDNKNVVFCTADGTDDETLLRAGITNASAIITSLGEDADNLFIVLSARQLNKNLNIISRATNERTAKKLELAGANKIILPHKIGGNFMASLLVTPDLVEFIQRLSLEERNTRTNLEEISFDDCPIEYHDKSIAELNLRKKTGCTIIGYKTASGEYIINPDPDTKLVKGSNIIILGQPEQIQKLNDLFNIK